MTNIQSLVQRCRPSVDALAEHYARSDSHVQFVKDIVRQTKTVVVDNNIEYSYDKINEAKERLEPVVATFHAQIEIFTARVGEQRLLQVRRKHVFACAEDGLRTYFLAGRI